MVRWWASILSLGSGEGIPGLVGQKRDVPKGWGYTHDRRADKYPYPQDRRADKDSYPHDRNVTDNLCSLIKLCFAFIMVIFSA